MLKKRPVFRRQGRGLMTKVEHGGLCEFMDMPLGSADQVMDHFGALEGAVRRGRGGEAFVYVPGQRRDRVVLVAHADTVWDGDMRDRAAGHSYQEKDGVISSTTFGVGLGADDRAGCAILWILRDLGHSLLVTSGEETGTQGARWLMSINSDISSELNGGHQFMVEFDRRNARDFKCYGVGTDEFRQYLREVTGYSEPDRSSSTDITVLCRSICGVNLSVGYRDEHSAYETLVLKDWHHTLDMARNWLSTNDLPRFPLGRGQAVAC